MNPAGRNVDDLGYWATAMKRLARASESTSNAMQPSGERAEEMFAERARALAEPVKDSRRKERLDLIAFEIGAQKVAIESRDIRAVIPVADPAPVPGVSEILAGVINFRGIILPVFRLERVLGADETMRSATIVLGEDRPEFAIFANKVEDVGDLSSRELLNVSWQARRDGLAALGLSENALNVLDGRALLSDPRFYVGRNAARM